MSAGRGALDLERGTVTSETPGRNALDLDRVVAACAESETSNRMPVPSDPEASKVPRETPRPPPADLPLEEAGHACLICLDRPRDGRYAIRVPCFRGTGEKRKLIKVYARRGPRRVRRADDGLSNPAFEDELYAPLEDWEKYRESGKDIYVRLVNACFEDLGKWRGWLRYYGVVRVTEVTIRLNGRQDSNGRLFGLIEPLDLEKIKKKCDEAVENYPILDGWNDFDWCDGVAHAKKCEMEMEHAKSECLAVKANRAKERLERMNHRELLTQCARDPDIADSFGYDTLSGMAQDSCVYPTIQHPKGEILELPKKDQPRTGTPIRALHFVFGWQTDRIALELPYIFSIGLFGIAVVWLAALLVKGTGSDWNLAMAFAQVVAASIAILMSSLRY